jgi:hypothetical protein
MKAAIIKCYNGGSYTKEIRSEKKYFINSVTWNALASTATGFRYSDYGALFDSAGSSMFPSEDDYLYLIGLLNTKVTTVILEIINPTLNFGAGTVGNIPILVEKSKRATVEALAHTNITLSHTDWDSFETSWDFTRHPLVYSERTVAATFAKWTQEASERFTTLKANEEELNRIFIDIYGLQGELTPEVDDKDVTVRLADLKREIRSLVSYAVGCMFGRYSLDVEGLAYAGGDWDPTKHETFIPDKDNILPICDDEYFDDDIVGLFIGFIRTVYGVDTLEENLKFIADALGGKGTPREVIRGYFLSGFYADHLKIYQKRPIYWLFDSGKKNGFKALVYLHRYSKDLLARMRTEYVHEQQERYRTQLLSISSSMNTASGAERAKLLKQQAKFVDQSKEIGTFEEKFHHLADMAIEIDLDDGVKVNYEKFGDVLAKI